MATKKLDPPTQKQTLIEIETLQAELYRESTPADRKAEIRRKLGKACEDLDTRIAHLRNGTRKETTTDDK